MVHSSREKLWAPYRTVDAGMIQITSPRRKDARGRKKPWPYVKIGESTTLKAGHWCLALGHPGGYQLDRLPVLRLGRILAARANLLVSDCTLVGGDSGGPLIDLDGKVIGIHSRIGGSLTANVHVPIEQFRQGWKRMAKAEVWGAFRKKTGKE